MFSTQIDIVLQHPIESLRSWLLTIQLGQELHGGADQIIDEFSHNSPLQSWLRLQDN